MIAEESGQSAELNSDHGDQDEGLRAGWRGAQAVVESETVLVMRRVGEFPDDGTVGRVEELDNFLVTDAICWNARVREGLTHLGYGAGSSIPMFLNCFRALSMSVTLASHRCRKTFHWSSVVTSSS